MRKKTRDRAPTSRGFSTLVPIDQSQVNALIRIHLQKEECGATHIGKPDDAPGLELEMLLPTGLPRMEQPYQRVPIRLRT